MESNHRFTPLHFMYLSLTKHKFKKIRKTSKLCHKLKMSIVPKSPLNLVTRMLELKRVLNKSDILF